MGCVLSEAMMGYWCHVVATTGQRRGREIGVREACVVCVSGEVNQQSGGMNPSCAIRVTCAPLRLGVAENATRKACLRCAIRSTPSGSYGPRLPVGWQLRPDVPHRVTTQRGAFE
jgi:hypothetical protein